MEYLAPSFVPVSKLSRADQKSVVRVTLVTEDPEKTGKGAKKAKKLRHAALSGSRGALFIEHSRDGETIAHYGIGRLERFTPQEAADFGEAMGQQLLDYRASCLVIEAPKTLKDPTVFFNFLKGAGLSHLKHMELKEKPPTDLASWKTIAFDAAKSAEPSKEDRQLLASLCEGIAFARVIGDLPSSVATPQGVIDRFQDRVTKAIKDKRLSIEVWDEKRISREKMGLLKAVSQGSDIPPRFLIVTIPAQLKSPAKESGKAPQPKRLALIGKGIVFDTGGINLKTTSWTDLLAMKRDMCGAAAVLGAATVLANLKLATELLIITPLTFNSIGSKAVIPGDIVRSYAGKTVEIQNTDAEGRLVLADAIHYAVLNKCDAIIDVATLTGAIMVALGSVHSGIFTNHQPLGDLVLKTSFEAGEPGWPMPISPRYREEMKGALADLQNMGRGREAGASLGAVFLENFVANTPWCHIDIAGTMDMAGPAAARAQIKAAGRMVHALVETARQFEA